MILCGDVAGINIVIVLHAKNMDNECPEDT